MNEPTVPHPPELVSYFDRLQELFDRLVDLPAGEREAELERLSADAPALAGDLRGLLEAAARADSPLDKTAVRLGEDREPPLPRIPGFRVHRRIGRGGSATVYLADQEHAEFTRTVALKVVDRLVDAASLRGVREEQRILARLEHPGIARLYDSGVTPWGQHWLAMEHVEGESILEHCNARRLPVRERIELFLPVLDAVAYAHARGIVHRDLKPANLFVTRGGEPRLLDFGIAKISDPADQDPTLTLRRALTPAYASPEQLHGGRITSSSDVYSLGVVLYELLVGSLPGDDTEQRRAVGGDIDAVLNKALRRRPEERYASVTAFADDLRNVLAGAPVMARRGDRSYRARKFLRRRRTAIAAAMVVMLLAASWPVISRWRGSRPEHEVAIYHDAAAADSETRRWLRDGAERLARLDGLGARDSFRRAASSSKGQVPAEALAWDGVARAEDSLGEIGRAAEAARRAGALIAGRADALPRDEAERLRARALAANRDWNGAVAALEALFGAQPERVDVGLDLVGTLLDCGRTDAADTALGRVRQLGPRDAGGDPRIDLAEAEVALQLSEFQRAAAAAARARDRAATVKAVGLGQRAARLHAEAIGQLDRRDEARRDLTAIAARNQALGLTGEAAATRLALGAFMARSAPPEETRRTLDAALAGCIQAGDRRCEISARGLLAMMDGMAGKLEEAIAASRAGLAGARAIGDRWCEGYVLSQLHVLYNWADDPEAHEAIRDPLLAALRDSGNRRLLLTTLGNLSLARIDALDLQKAEAYIAEADVLSRRVGSQLASASIDRARGYLEETRGDRDLARKSYTAALEKARQAGVPWSVAQYGTDLATLELHADRVDAATQHARESIAAFTSVGDTVLVKAAEGVLAWSEARRGNHAEARRLLAALRRNATEDGSDSARFTLLNIEGHVAAALGDWPRAIELRRQTIRMASAWNVQAALIGEQVHLAEALKGAGRRRELETLVNGMVPELERSGLHGVARELRAMIEPPGQT